MSDLIYDALMLGRNKSVAREEYLVSKGEKAACRFEAREKNIYLTNIENDTTGIIHLELREEGFAEIEVYCADSFITLDRKVITTDDFENGVYAFSFTVRADMLHGGKNFARIIFRTPVCACSCEIVVHDQAAFPFAGNSSRRRVAQLVRDYLDLRMGNLFQTEWQDRALKLLADVNGSDINDLFMLLYKANVLISCGRSDEARDITEFVSGQITKLPKNEWDLICFYMYVNSMLAADDEETQKICEDIRMIFNENPSWKILWILIYMDPQFSSSPKRMLEDMEGEFLLRDCNSPVIFYEAAEIFRRSPELITEVSEFALETLNFAAKNDFLNIEITLHMADLIWNTDDYILTTGNITAAIRFMQAAYERFDSGLALKALCKLLVCGKCTDSCYHIYFERAIRSFLETRDIYNYFVYTADQSSFIQLPSDVLEYFVGREAALGEYRAYYFACVVSGKDNYGEFYGKYIGSIARFAAENIEAGRIDRSLAVIYKDLMDTGLLSKELYQRMTELICTREIVTDNPLAVSVLTFHREFNEYQEAYINDGHAFIRQFTDDAAILFKDVAGNLYHNIGFRSEDLVEWDRYIDLCMENSRISRYMLLGRNLERLQAVKDPVEILEYMFNNIGSGKLRASYEQSLLKKLIIGYSEASSDRAVSDKLLEFMRFDLDEGTRSRLIEVMIDRKMFKEAFIEIEKDGFAGLSSGYAASLAHMLAELSDYEEDPMMTQLCCRAYMEEPFDPIIFKYMRRHYRGDLNVLLKMYDDAHTAEVADIEIAGRILEAVLDRQGFPDSIESIFAHYYEDGSDRDLVKRCMTDLSDRYLYENDQKCTFIFDYIEKSLIQEKEFPDRVVAAFLLHIRKKSSLPSQTIKLAEDRLKDLVRRSIMLDEFRDFAKFFKLPAVLSNTCIAEVLSLPAEEKGSIQMTTTNMFAGAPVISYEIKQRRGGIEGTEAMKEVFEGCYCRYFTLFFGESVTYRVADGPYVTVSYNDMQTVRDGSRYSEIDNMIRLLHGHDADAISKAVEDYYVREQLINKLF